MLPVYLHNRAFYFHFVCLPQDTGKRRVKGNVDKDRPTFVLLHGLSGSTASWDEVIVLVDFHRIFYIFTSTGEPRLVLLSFVVPFGL